MMHAAMAAAVLVLSGSAAACTYDETDQVNKLQQLADSVAGGQFLASESADGGVSEATYPQTREFNGGFCILELPTRAAAIEWAAKLATACRCPQELREFHYDPEN